MRSFLIFLLCLSLFVANCNKGVAPTETEQLPETDLNFACKVSGGELTGAWTPRAINPLEAVLADPSQIAGMVDSLALATSMTGKVKFHANKSFEWNTIIQVTPKITTGNLTIPMSPFADTLNESGTYQQPWKEVIIVSLHPATFKIDTVGYTANKDSLRMVTLATAFPGFNFIKYYLVFHFVKE